MAVLAGLTLAKGLAIGGTILSTVGAIQQGNAAQASANYQAQQLDAQAKTERAVAQRQANEERRQKELVISRARAVGAASGGGQDYDLLGDLEEEGEYRAATAMWEGEEAAKGRTNQANAARFEGKQAKKASRFKAAGTILGGATSFYDRFS